MALSIPDLITGVVPDRYFDNEKGVGSKEHQELLAKFKKLISEKGISKAINELKKQGEFKSKAEGIHKLVYDSPTETLEPIYFFILDLMNEMGLGTEKLVDNFVSTPGSQHFGDMGQRSSIMQQQGAKLLGDINTVLRSILNLIYDLRDFKIRLKAYDDLEDTSKKDQALLSLKQLWMDKVDAQKGNSSIKAMALGQSGFTTLIDAFLMVNDSKDIDNLDLNDIVKRILKPRLHDFNVWVQESEIELRKRYEIERTYLKSQVNSLKIYSRWARPYLKAAQELEMNESGRNPALVKMFNSLVLELTILGKSKVNVDSLIKSEEYPQSFAKLKFKRQYYSCVLVDFVFRGIPNRTQQGFVVGGRAEITFRSYALNEEEIKKINQELENSDLQMGLNLVEGATTESLENLEEDIKEFMEEEDEKRGKKKEEKKKESKDSSNPFIALLGLYDKKPKEKKEEKKEEKIEKIEKDNWAEKYLRKTAASGAEGTSFAIFEIYKKAHGMASFP